MGILERYLQYKWIRKQAQEDLMINNKGVVGKEEIKYNINNITWGLTID